MSAHTPGPWVVAPYAPDAEDAVLRVRRRTYTTPHGVIAEVICETDEILDVDLANAHLIAAAPDLLAACRKAATVIIAASDAEEAGYLLDAIAKAEGR